MRARKRAEILQGDCLEALEAFADNYFDSIVTDAPYGIAFMGKGWDTFKSRRHFVRWMERRQEQFLRVLKPGGYQLCMAGTRTYHWSAWAIESAGFDVDDQLDWLYSQGFQKGANIAKNIQKKLGVKPIGKKKASLGMAKNPQWNALHSQLVMPEAEGLAARWKGWGTMLAPAHEGIVLAQKPIGEKTIAENVLRWGTGGLNIKDCLIGERGPGTSCNRRDAQGNCQGHGNKAYGRTFHAPASDLDEDGRKPKNVIMDEGAGAFLDAVTGRYSAPKQQRRGRVGGHKGPVNLCHSKEAWNHIGTWPGDPGGGISRLYYCPKPSRSEKERGCSGLPLKSGAEITGRKEGSIGITEGDKYAGTTNALRRNTHPTGKPVALMEYLCRLITPPGGMILDPFCGSGTTVVAAIREGFCAVGIEKEKQYAKIAEARMSHAMKMGRKPKGFFDA